MTGPALAAVPLAATRLADSDAGKGSPIGLFVVLLLVVATYLLYRSMSRHLRKLPERFPGAQPAEADPADEVGVPDEAAEPAAVVGQAEPAVAGTPEPPTRPADDAEVHSRAGRPVGENGSTAGPV